jgi:hypothetical protein
MAGEEPAGRNGDDLIVQQLCQLDIGNARSQPDPIPIHRFLATIAKRAASSARVKVE